MIDLISATQDAVVAALKASPANTLALIRVAVKPDTTEAFIRLGDIASRREGGKGSKLRAIEFELHHVIRGTNNAPLLAMMNASEEALDGVQLVAAGVEFSRVAFEDDAIAGLGPDGVTIVGLSKFSVFAEPAS